jgi:hypothetical protein
VEFHRRAGKKDRPGQTIPERHYARSPSPRAKLEYGYINCDKAEIANKARGKSV